MPSSKLNTIIWMLIILYVQLSKDLVQGCTNTRTDTKTRTANEKSSDPKPYNTSLTQMLQYVHGW